MKARMLIAWLMVVILILAGYVSVRNTLGVKAASAASSACAVNYQVNQWSGGFTAQVQITNNGAALTSWALTWTFAGNQLISSAWNASVTQTGAAVTAQNLGYNGSLPTGGSQQFGFQATVANSNAVPTNFALNGLSCGGTATPTATTTATATPTATPSPGSSCAGAIFCDNFESQTGTVPSGSWQVSYPNCQGTGSASVDRTMAHSGSTSIRVDGHNGYCNHVFFGLPLSFAGLGSDLYVRYFLRHSTALPAGHVTSAVMRDTNDGGNDLRIGGQNGALQWK